MNRPTTSPSRYRLPAALLAALLGAPLGDLGAQEADPLGWMDYGWRLATLDGSPRPLERFRGEVLVINVWAPWCRPCRDEMPSLQALHDRFAPQGVRFLTVAVDRPGPVERFLRRHRLSLPVFLELDRFPPALGVAAVPTTLVVDRRGAVVLRHRGAADWDQPEMHAFLTALLHGAAALPEGDRPQ